MYVCFYILTVLTVVGHRASGWLYNIIRNVVHHNPPYSNRQSAANEPQAVDSNKFYSAFQLQCYCTVRPSFANEKKTHRKTATHGRIDSLHGKTFDCCTCTLEYARPAEHWPRNQRTLRAQRALANATFEHTDNICHRVACVAWHVRLPHRITSPDIEHSTQYLVASYHDRIALRSAHFARRVLIVTTTIIYYKYLYTHLALN